jgi:acyl-CoA reductase-like NAD-dependent aldehyde dehydrogenase
MHSLPMKTEQVLGALPPQKLFIHGKWVDSDSSERLEVYSPSSGKLLATVPHASEKDVNRAVESARKAGEGWRLTPPFERSSVCHRIADRILLHKETIAAIISLEQGKPYFSEALPEVEETAENFRIAAEDVKRLETPIIPARDPNKRLFTLLRSLSVRGASSRRGIFQR